MLGKISSKLSMNAKQLGSYIIIILFFVVITNTSYNNVNHLRDQTLEIGETAVPKIVLVGNVKEEFTRIHSIAATHKFTSSDQELENQLNVSIANVNKDVKELGKYKFSSQDEKLLSDFEQNFKEYIGYLERNTGSSQGQLDKLKAIGEENNNDLNNLYTAAQKSAKVTINQSTHDSNRDNYEILILSVIASIFSVLIALHMTRTIRKSVKGVVNNVNLTNNSVAEIKKSIDQTAISAQELDASMNNANDSISELVASIQQVAGNTNVTAADVIEISAEMEQMSASITLVARSVDTLAASSEESSSAIQEMMVSIEQVAGSVENATDNVEQISAAIEEMNKSIQGVSANAVDLTKTAEQTYETIQEMAVSIQQVADSAGTVNELSKSVKNDALEGTHALNETLNGMKEISQVINKSSNVMETLGKSAEEIGSIIQVIDGIADQTNLLALNAAIEAARAGENGKGFAVVAEEVRKLAERSAAATKEITELIKGIQEETTFAINSIKEGSDKVKVGNQLAEMTDTAIKKIMTGITRVTEEMNQIADATKEQTRNSEFITKAVKNVTQKAVEMNHSTKEQTLTSEEIVRAVSNVKEQVRQISIATAEQAQGSRAIISAVENVSYQTSSVTNSTKEQALTAEEIVHNINSIKEMVDQISAAVTTQAKYGQEIAIEVGNVLKQTETVHTSIETQTKEVELVAQSVAEVKSKVEML